MRALSAIALPAAFAFFVACSSSSGPTSTSTSGSDAAATSPTDPSKPNDSQGNDAGKSDSGTGTPAKASGLEGFCEHYFECGGHSYDDVKACVDDSENYWGACRRPELDAFGTCMMDVKCTNWSPDAYNPASGPCADEWTAIGKKKCP